DAVARDMVLAHHRRQPALPAAVELAEPAVAIPTEGWTQNEIAKMGWACVLDCTLQLQVEFN
ncbi:hypothetical protein, partial [Roseovarius sp. D22-M7]|uniref:hypothetical protein n=1 Tax=Roseovarius sp. D22-M7 TaxID=3127116 RepID=UPI00300FB7A9